MATAIDEYYQKLDRPFERTDGFIPVNLTDYLKMVTELERKIEQLTVARQALVQVGGRPEVVAALQEIDRLAVMDPFEIY